MSLDTDRSFFQGVLPAKSDVARGLIVVLALLAVVFSAHGDALQELDTKREQARRAYDLEACQVLFKEIQEVIGEDPTDDSARYSLAYAALATAELQRITFEESKAPLADRRAMGKVIDEAAKLGLRALEGLAESSEKYRVRADLYGLMIRTHYQGTRYGKKMDNATEMALELGVDNPHAYVTGSKHLLFAKERRGGDVEEALALLNRALELDGDHVMGLVLRGTAHEKLEDFDSAQMDWERALELNPSCKPAKDKLEALSKPAH